MNGKVALDAFVLVARLLGTAVDPDRVLHDFARPVEELTLADLQRLAPRYDVKARLRDCDAAKVAKMPTPLVLTLADGSYGVAMRRETVGEDTRWIVHVAGAPRPEVWTQAQFAEQFGGTVLLIATRGSIAGAARRFGLTWFVPLLVKYRRAVRDVLIASVFLQLLGLVTPLLFQIVIDKVLVHQSLSTLDVVIFGMVVVSVWETVLGGLRAWLLAHTSNRLDVELSARVFAHAMSVPLGYFESRRTGDTVARIREVESLRAFFTSGALNFIIDALFSFVFLGVMALYSVMLTLIVMVSLIFYVVISLAVTPRLRALIDERTAASAANNSFLVESVASIATIKTFAAEPQFRRRWEDSFSGYVKVAFNAFVLSNWASQGIQIVSKLTTAATLYFGAQAVIAGDLTVGGLVAFNMLAGRLAQPILRIAQLWTDFQQVRVSVTRLADLLDTPEERRGQPAGLRPAAIKGAIRFAAVHFRYRPDLDDVLRGLDLDIAAGETIGIVGASGSGKSTLAKVLQRLYVPERGKITVDGTDIALIDPAMLRRAIGIVPQDSVLFHRSIAANIAIADPGAPIDRVVAAAKVAGAHEFILQLPLGYETVIGERGDTLSGGQRQRVAIARALLGDPRILIFDEATSALDAESEAVIQGNLARIAQGRTTIIIAHRLSAVRACNRIVAIAKGQVAEVGSHDQLVGGDGVYARLYRAQSGLGR